uniref:Si:ch211-242b18.1 n=1 Tax=Labrus bergylta TaxID=56723 RepID=A0A3Q3GNW7_9LABR
MKETCRICGRELCGNQRRWIFHPTAKLNLQVLLSHALGQELTRDGRGEFACSKCTFMLDRMYRFDTVIARVEALSIERLQRLLQEKHRLRHCIGGLYRKTNSEEGAVTITGGNEGPGDGMVDISEVTVCRGCSYWRVADSDYEAVCKVPRKLARSISCGPSTRYSASVIGGSVTGEAGEKKHVEDSEEAPSSLTLVPGSQDPSRKSDSDRTLAGQASSSPSIASLETTEEYIHPGGLTDGLLSSPRDPIDDRLYDSLSEERAGASHDPASPGPSLSLALCLLQSYTIYRPVRSSKGSKLPVLLRRSSSNGGLRLDLPNPVLGFSYETQVGERDNHIRTPELETPLIHFSIQNLNLADMEELMQDLYKEYPRPPPHQSLVEEQQSQLNQYECAAGQCVSELQKAQLQVQSLQAKIHESEANNMKLQEKLNEMECELRSIRQAAQSQERTIQGLTESIGSKDCEAQELYQLIEGQNTTLCKLREMAHHNQLSKCKVRLEKSHSIEHYSMSNHLMFVLQDLRSALQKTRSDLQAKESALKESEAERNTLVQEKERSITQLKHSLEDKEQQLQVNHTTNQPPPPLNSYTAKCLPPPLLQRSIDDKFRCVEEREEQVRRLQLALREKERDLERLRCILSNNEETITSLDGLVRSKELELEQAAEAYRNLQWLKQQTEEKERGTQREKDTIINQLQAALQARSQETQDLTAALVARVHAGPSEVVEELKARLALKEKLFEELLSDRSRQSNEHQAQVQDMLNTLSSKDQYLQARESEAVTGAPMRSLLSRRADVQQLEEEKRTLESQLEEMKFQLERNGYNSVSQMRFAAVTNFLILSLQSEQAGKSSEVGALWQDIGEGRREQAARLQSDLDLSHRENRELQERLMVSEATVQAQAEQLKEYRDLLTETSVQQASKQVQVDLQDLGYETCGRSENEAEREDMCTSLSHQQDYDGRDESASLEHLVKDLRSQLTRCHKVIRGLQLRVRSLSTTSDYASSLERTPRKVNWAFETSPAPSGVEEDEGWMSDTQGIRSGSKPGSELQELMARVASLEAQLKSSRLDGKGQAEEGKSPGRHDQGTPSASNITCYQTPETEECLMHLHLLYRHLSQVFEELLRSNDIDYYMGQSFREQLAQNSALAQRVVAKIRGRKNHDDKAGHELLALRLSKELQHKDKIIESLHTKLQQRPETPSSCQALSETTDQSDRTSLVSDEYRTNEDLELCSDLDAREFQEEQHHASEQDGITSSSCPNMPPVSFSLSVPFGPVAWGKEVPSDPQPRALSVIAVRPELDTLYKQMNEQNRGEGSGDVCHHVWSVNLIEEHLQEVRCLRQRLEESIRTNERLRQQLEERLATYRFQAQVTQLSNEIRVLKEENLALQSHSCEEVVQLREAVFTAHARLKQAELEAEQWKEELRRLQAHSQEQGQQIHMLRQERQNSQEKTNRLQHEVSLLQQQLCESRELIHSLQSELQVYDRHLCDLSSGYLCELPGLPVELGELLGEVRSLRAQLQTSVQENSALKQLELHKQLEQKLGVVSPRTPSLSALTASPQRENFYSVLQKSIFDHLCPADPLDPHSELEGDAPDGSFANRNGRHAIGHVDDFSSLQQQVLEGCSLVQRMETTLQAYFGCVKSLLSNTKTLRQILEEAMSLLKMFWRAALPSTDSSVQNLKKVCQTKNLSFENLRLSNNLPKRIFQILIRCPHQGEHGALHSQPM